MQILLGLALMLLGIVTGIYVFTMIHDYRIGDLSAGQYTALHQMRDKTFRKVMPVLRLTTLALVLVSAIVALESGVPRALAVASTVMIMIDIAITVRRQLPINQKIQSWTEATIPADWAHERDRWALHHNVRSILAVAAYACFIAAVLLTIAR